MPPNYRALTQDELRRTVKAFGAVLLISSDAPAPSEWDQAIDAIWPRVLLAQMPDGKTGAIQFDNLRHRHTIWEVELFRHNLGIKRKDFWLEVARIKAERGGVRP